MGVLAPLSQRRDARWGLEDRQTRCRFLQSVRIELLGRFRVLAAGLEVVFDGWPARLAAEFAQLLALAEEHCFSIKWSMRSGRSSMAKHGP
ncbi:hypothetical protein [Kribbella sp. CA-293567]|uniref:hypothetical protein n=1 Tax=Kribbella sp. CA-293567 TaxID=3002436 RepID=UPI0022DE5BC7|nr:hypothetical protein [Kribbella sp. CA-293567]WBQ04478.1 hypothetical protein OX958_31510 [Kribbella sp. CA-293567]